jgi:hypothetical protein
MNRVIEPKLCLLTHEPGFYNQLIMANKDMANNNNNNNNNNIVIIIIMAKKLRAKMLLPTYQVNTFFKHFPPKFQNCREGQKDK